MGGTLGAAPLTGSGHESNIDRIREFSKVGRLPKSWKRVALRRAKHGYRASRVAGENVVLGGGRDSRLGTVHRLCGERNVGIARFTDLNVGAGNAWASHNKLTSAPFATSNASDLADFGNLGDTRPAGSHVPKKKKRKGKRFHPFPPPFYVPPPREQRRREREREKERELPVSRGWRCLSGAGDRDRGSRGSHVGDAFRVALKGGRLRSHGLWIATRE